MDSPIFNRSPVASTKFVQDTSTTNTPPKGDLKVLHGLLTCVKNVKPDVLRGVIENIVETEKWPKFVVYLLAYFIPCYFVFNYIANSNRIKKLKDVMNLEKEAVYVMMSLAEEIAFAKIEKDDEMRYIEINLNRNSAEDTAKNVRITEVRGAGVKIEDLNCPSNSLSFDDWKFEEIIRWSVDTSRSRALLYENPLDTHEVEFMIMEDFCRQYHRVGQEGTDLGIAIINELGEVLNLGEREIGALCQQWYDSPSQLLNKLLYRNDVVAWLENNRDTELAKNCQKIILEIKEKLWLIEIDPTRKSIPSEGFVDEQQKKEQQEMLRSVSLACKKNLRFKEKYPVKELDDAYKKWLKDFCEKLQKDKEMKSLINACARHLKNCTLHRHSFPGPSVKQLVSALVDAQDVSNDPLKLDRIIIEDGGEIIGLMITINPSTKQIVLTKYRGEKFKCINLNMGEDVINYFLKIKKEITTQLKMPSNHDDNTVNEAKVFSKHAS